MYKFNKISITVPEEHIFGRNLQTDSKSYIEMKRLKQDKAILKKNKFEELILLYFKMYYKTLLIKTVVMA